VFAITPISWVAGCSGLLVRALLCGDFEGLGVLVVEWVGNNEGLGRFEKPSGVGEGEQEDSERSESSLVKMFRVWVENLSIQKETRFCVRGR
jgi:hypothetical protein